MLKHSKRSLTILFVGVGLLGCGVFALSGGALADHKPNYKPGGGGGGGEGGGDSVAYLITDLLTGFPESINNFGEVVGVYDSPEGSHAVLWRTNAAGDLVEFIDLGTLGGTGSRANDINDAGQVVGWSALGTPGGGHAFLLTPEDTDNDGNPDLWYRDDDLDGANDLMRDLGTLATNGSVAYGVNDDGQVVGWALFTASNAPGAVLWQLDAEDNIVLTQLSDLDTRPFAINNCREVGANEEGIPVVLQVAADGRILDKIELLGSLGGPSHAHGMNELGQLVGDSEFADGGYHPVILWQDGAITDLGSLGGNGWATDINGSLQVVGGSSNGKPRDATHYGFLWQNGQMINLTKLIGGGWTLYRANGINEAGQIVGSARHGFGDPRRGFLLTPN